MKYQSLALLILSLSILSNCTIYRSPERKDFESESPGFSVQNLKKISCRNTSVKSKADSSKLITVIRSTKLDSHFLWEYLIQGESYFESDNLKGVYCAFENS